jgi:hypothetical protein
MTEFFARVRCSGNILKPSSMKTCSVSIRKAAHFRSASLGSHLWVKIRWRFYFDGGGVPGCE